MPKMRAIQVSRPGGPFESVEREIPQPGPRQVRVKVQACGLCHSDSLTKDGHFPGVTYPRVPGHEIAGVIDAVGSEVPRWKIGQRVGVGWLGSYCGHCESCRRGIFITCANQRVTGITMDGGYQEYVLVPFDGLALIPEEINPIDAAPLMCAGITTFNSLRNSGVRGGDTVAVLGIWPFNSPPRWAFAQSPSREVQTKSHWRGNWVPDTISTAPRPIRRPNFSVWAAPRSSSQPRRAHRRSPPPLEASRWTVAWWCSAPTLRRWRSIPAR